MVCAPVMASAEKKVFGLNVKQVYPAGQASACCAALDVGATALVAAPAAVLPYPSQTKLVPVLKISTDTSPALGPANCTPVGGLLVGASMAMVTPPGLNAA